MHWELAACARQVTCKQNWNIFGWPTSYCLLTHHRDSLGPLRTELRALQKREQDIRQQLEAKEQQAAEVSVGHADSSKLSLPPRMTHPGCACTDASPVRHRICTPGRQIHAGALVQESEAELKKQIDAARAELGTALNSQLSAAEKADLGRLGPEVERLQVGGRPIRFL